MWIQQNLTCFVSYAVLIFLELTCGHLWASGPFRRVFTETMRTATGKIVNLHFEILRIKLMIADMVPMGQSQHPMTMSFIFTARLFLTCSSASNGAEKYALYEDTVTENIIHV